MEKSNSTNNNSMRRGVFSNNNERMSSSGVASSDKEESGWTMYFNDYSNEYNYNHDENNISSMISIGDHLESSLVSDAASSAAKKFAHDHHQDHEQHVMGCSLDKGTYDRSSSLMMKKRKTKVVLLDDALEDTASSPANSPKVYDLMSQFDRQQQQKNIMDISQEKTSGSTSSKLKIDGRSGYGSVKDDDNNGRDNDTSELKKKGLCLVPLSMVVNYLD